MPSCIPRSTRVAAALTFVLLSVSTHAQTANDYHLVFPANTQIRPVVPLAPSSALMMLENFPIGVGDVLTVNVYGEPDMNQQVRVADSGNIDLSIGGSVHVAGLTVEQAGQAISNHLRNVNILRNGRVTVFVQTASTMDYITHGATVIGEVTHPGIVPVTSARRLMDVISMAGGLTNVADRHITIQHGKDRADRQTVFLSNNPQLSLDNANATVSPGDTVVVPRAGIIYVLGDVYRPGGYVMQNESRMTLLQAIAVCGGTNTTASKGSARLIRKVNGDYVEVPVHLKKVEKGEAADVELQADDVLYIPFSFPLHIVMGTPAILPAAASASIYAIF